MKIRLLKPDGSLLMELSEADSRRVEAIAERDGITVSDVIRRILRRGWEEVMRVN